MLAARPSPPAPVAPPSPSLPTPQPDEAFVVEADGRPAEPAREGRTEETEEEARAEAVVDVDPAAAAPEADSEPPSEPALAATTGAVAAAEPKALPPPEVDIGVADSLAPPQPDAAAGDQFDLRDMPSFVRKAEREARWRRPQVRAALAVGIVLAALALAGQWMFAERDLVAARAPTLAPALAAACDALGCQIGAPRALEALRVESSGLVRIDKGDLYRLSVALRNLRAHEVALPAVELALTDTQGRLIARRVLGAAELGARVASLASGAELTLQCTIQVAMGPVAGYTIELFYP